MERSPAFAGQLYPGQEAELRQTVERLIPSPGVDAAPAIAIVAPHAGYTFSGPIAAAAYREVAVPSYAIVLCPNHAGRGARAAIMSHGHWRIPGGRIPIAEALAEEFRSAAGLTEDPEAHTHEHGVEVQLPLLLRCNPRVRVVPVTLSDLPFETCRRIGHALGGVIARHGRDVLIVASTDMSHYVPLAEAHAKDRLVLDCIETMDPQGLYRTVRDRNISMCGYIATTITLLAAQGLGATQAQLLQYGNSGDVSGDFERVVGYASLVIR